MEQKLRLVQGVGARVEKRIAERVRMEVPGQIVCKDARGKTQMAPVVTRDISETGVAVECRTSVSIPMYRLVYFQVDRGVRHRPGLPPALRKPSVLTAVFRVGSASDVTGAPTEYGLRMLVEPTTAAAAAKVPTWTDASAACSRTA